jgi:hypothetical protein
MRSSVTAFNLLIQSSQFSFNDHTQDAFHIQLVVSGLANGCFHYYDQFVHGMSVRIVITPASNKFHVTNLLTVCSVVSTEVVKSWA